MSLHNHTQYAGHPLVLLSPPPVHNEGPSAPTTYSSPHSVSRRPLFCCCSPTAAAVAVAVPKERPRAESVRAGAECVCTGAVCALAGAGCVGEHAPVPYGEVQHAVAAAGVLHHQLQGLAVKHLQTHTHTHLPWYYV
jgi:hypothetical protein